MNTKILKLTSVAIIGFFGLYIYFVSNTVLHIVARQHNLEEIRSLNSQLSDLESSYLTLRGKVDLSAASTLGFTPKTSNFIHSTQILGSLSRNEI